jgi:uncharacterized protein (UPF0332 family)
VILDWKDCRKRKLIKNIKRDEELIQSLIKSSSKKLKSQGLLELDSTTSTSKISLSYDALRELLEALSLTYNYRIYNHECYAAFLNEILRERGLAEKFDKFRKLRNAINYYGKDVSIKKAESIIKEMLILINRVKEVIGKNI